MQHGVSAMPSIVTFSTVFFLLSLVIATLLSGVHGHTINSFEINLNGEEKTSQSTDFSPPSSAGSSYKWVSNSNGPCFGCGIKSYKALRYDCIHRLPMQLTAGNYSRSLMGVFKVSDSECTSRRITSPPPVTYMACGPPCSELRLLRGGKTGCRCDHQRKKAYDVPDLICQNNRNKTVSLSLCKFFYEKNSVDYEATGCDYSTVCVGPSSWIAGNWSVCSDESPVSQKRQIFCVVKSPVPLGVSEVYYQMHESMCAGVPKLAMMQMCARWTAERNYRCICATKTATRRVICLRDKKRQEDEECNWHWKPATSSDCTDKQIKECNGTST